MKKKRNKKYTPKVVKVPVRLWSWESDRSSEDRFVNVELFTDKYRGAKDVIFPQKKTWIGVEGSEAFSAINGNKNWTLIVRALMWYADGYSDIVPAIVQMRGVTLNQLEETAKLMRKEILKTAKREHIVDVGWYAETFDKTPQNEESCIDEFELGETTEERQMLWNYAWQEEVKDIV